MPLCGEVTAVSSALPFNRCCSVLTPLLGCGGWEAATVLPCWRWRTPARGQELATTQQHPEGHESEPLCDSRTPRQDGLGVLAGAGMLPASPDFVRPCARAEGQGQEQPPGQSRDAMFSEHHLAGRVLSEQCN